MTKPSMMRGVVRLLCVAALCLTSSVAGADDRIAEATGHFRRAVDLYNETDFTAALVEFKRAYAIAPNVNLLYNIGQTEYQLQLYADALTAFEQYVREGGTAHKAEVESAIGVLRSRVGRVRVVTDVIGADVQIDDRSVGKSPLVDAVMVGIGRRKVTIAAPDRVPVTKWIDIASGDEATVTLPVGSKPEPPPPIDRQLPVTPRPVEDASQSHVPVGAWVLTGALAAGTAVTGALALSTESQLNAARDAFPGNAHDLSQKATTTKTFAISADLLGVATVVVGGLSLYWTLSRSSSTETRAAITPAGATVTGSF
jgi:hypothetical protein